MITKNNILVSKVNHVEYVPTGMTAKRWSADPEETNATAPAFAATFVGAKARPVTDRSWQLK